MCEDVTIISPKPSEKEFLHDLNSVCWTCDRVSNCPRVRKNLVVVATLHHNNQIRQARTHKEGLICPEGLISEEVDLFKAFVFDVLECICLVPTIWKDVERDLATDGVRQAIICKSFPQDHNKGRSYTVDLNSPQIG
jgi:hypothetical protein